LAYSRTHCTYKLIDPHLGLIYGAAITPVLQLFSFSTHFPLLLLIVCHIECLFAFGWNRQISLWC